MEMVSAIVVGHNSKQPRNQFILLAQIVEIFNSMKQASLSYFTPNSSIC